MFLKREIESLGGKAHGYTCDLADRQAVYALAEKVKAEVGAVTILVNNAGIVSGKPFLETPDGAFAKILHCKLALDLPPPTKKIWRDPPTIFPDQKLHILCLFVVIARVPIESQSNPNLEEK